MIVAKEQIEMLVLVLILLQDVITVAVLNFLEMGTFVAGKIQPVRMIIVNEILILKFAHWARIHELPLT